MNPDRTTPWARLRWWWSEAARTHGYAARLFQSLAPRCKQMLEQALADASDAADRLAKIHDMTGQCND